MTFRANKSLPTRPVTLLTIVLSWLATLCQAQEIALPNIDIEYQNVRLSEVLNDLESRSGVRLYYLPSWVEVQRVTYKSRNAPLDQIIIDILKNTDLSVTVYDDKHIIISKAIKEENLNLLPEIIASQRLQGYPRKVLGSPEADSPTSIRLLRGLVTASESGEALSNAMVLIEPGGTKLNTDPEGRFAVNLPVGEYFITIDQLGRKEVKFVVELYQNGLLQTELEESAIELAAITIEDDRSDANLARLPGSTSLKREDIEKLTFFLAEPDVTRALLTQPGVTGIGEGLDGLYVRGSNADANLILLDEMPIFSTAHMFGFYPAVNKHIISETHSYKGPIPSRYGGRAGSVIELVGKNGNSKAITGNGNIGLFSTGLQLEGPIAKNRTSFVAAGRISYADWLLRRIEDATLRNSTASFYDFNGKVTHQLDPLSYLSLSGFGSQDEFVLDSDTIYNWSNQASSLTYQQQLSDRVSTRFVAYYSRYQFKINGLQSGTSFDLLSNLNQRGTKLRLNWEASRKHQFEAGMEANWYRVNPEELSPGRGAELNAFTREQENGLELAAFIEDTWQLHPRAKLNVGIRVSNYARKGPATLYTYEEGPERTAASITDTLTYNRGEKINSYPGLEPRLSLQFATGLHSTAFISYQQTRQYLHRLSEASAISPVDVWMLSGTSLEPLRETQLAAGYQLNMAKNKYTLSIEGFYKRASNVPDYKVGTQLLLNELISADLLQGEGKAYGLELMATKNTGRLEGQANYTWSTVQRKVAGSRPGETINSGSYYAADHDRPHNFFINTTYKLTTRISLSGQFQYITGRPITLPDARFTINNTQGLYYNSRNNARLADFHRLDLMITLKGTARRDKNWQGNWTLSILNVYARRNPYALSFQNSNLPETVTNLNNAQQLSIFGGIIPTISYNFRFKTN